MESYISAKARLEAKQADEDHPEPSDNPGCSALCLSGGGIRSATFCLGVIQGLAAKGWLDKFDYLSTVSGGGYIGSWLSSWIKRADPNHAIGLATVTAALANSVTLPNGKPKAALLEAEEIKRLRQYSNYLSPVVGWSTDMFALVSIYLRNLFLNWLVLLPLLATVVTLPMLSLCLVTWAGQAGSTAPLMHQWLLIIGASMAVLCITYVTSDVPYRRAHQTKRDHFVARCLLPLLVGCWAIGFAFQSSILNGSILSFAASWQQLSWAAPSTWLPTSNNALTLVIGGAAVHVLGAAIGLWARDYLRRHDGVWPTQQPDMSFTAAAVFRFLRMIIASGGLGALLIWFVAYQVQTNTQQVNRSELNALLATFSVPFLLLCFNIGTALYAAFTRTLLDEGPREWWGRSGGYCLLIGLVWIAAHLLVLWIPAYLVDFKTWLASIGGLGGLITVLGGYFGKNSQHAVDQKIKSKKSVFGERLLSLLAGVFLASLFIGASLAWIYTLAHFTDATLPLRGRQDYLYFISHCFDAATMAFWLLALLLGGICTLWLRLHVGVNAFSMQSLYSNRLVRAYLGATRQHPLNAKPGTPHRRHHAFTGFDPEDDLPLSSFSHNGKLQHVINCALNITQAAEDNLQWQQRKAMPFSFAAARSGIQATPLYPEALYDTAKYAGSEGGISLGEAMAISGAAASPNMGYHTSTLVSFVLYLFNVRLGSWLPNPLSPSNGAIKIRTEPRLRDGTIFAELLGQARSDSEFVYLSDGGHFENLGLYEIVRRQKMQRQYSPIVVVDASCDPEYVFDDLESCIRKLRTDLSVELTFDQGLPTATTQLAKAHYAIGLLNYGNSEPVPLVYIKPVLSGDEPEDVLRYAVRSRAMGKPFPHHSTGDQFFDEAQFESYRMLGLHSVAEFPSWNELPQNKLPQVVDHKAHDAQSNNSKQVDALLEEPPAKHWFDPANLLAALAALIAVPLGVQSVMGDDHSWLILLPYQAGYIGDPPIITDGQRRIALPLFEEANDCNGTVVTCRYGTTLYGGEKTPAKDRADLDNPGIARQALNKIAVKLTQCAVNAKEDLVVDVQGFSSSAPVINSDTSNEQRFSAHNNVLLADYRACVVLKALQEANNSSRVSYRLDSWQTDLDNQPAMCEQILSGEVNDSAYTNSAIDALADARRIDAKNKQGKDYHKPLAQLNRRVDLIPQSLGSCSMQDLAKALSMGSWHGVVD